MYIYTYCISPVIDNWKIKRKKYSPVSQFVGINTKCPPQQAKGNADSPINDCCLCVITYNVISCKPPVAQEVTCSKWNIHFSDLLITTKPNKIMQYYFSLAWHLMVEKNWYVIMLKIFIKMKDTIKSTVCVILQAIVMRLYGMQGRLLNVI